MKKKINSDAISGNIILALGAIFGMIFPSAAKWILLSFCTVGICSWLKTIKKKR